MTTAPMRKSTNILIPTALITLYYLFWAGLALFLLSRFPALRDVFPLGGIQDIFLPRTLLLFVEFRHFLSSV